MNSHQKQFQNLDPNISNANKIEEEIFTRLKTLQTEYDKLIFEFGSIKFRKLLIEEEEVDLKINYDKNRKEEISLLKEIKDKYGEGNVDMEKGTFIKKVL